MTSRERIKKILNFEIPDRIGLSDFYGVGVAKRWHKEGLPPEISPDDYFGIDCHHWHFDQSLQIKETIIEQDARTITRRNSWGAIEKIFKDEISFSSGNTGRQMIEPIFKSPGDWQKIKSMLAPNRKRIDVSRDDRYWKAKREEKFVVCAPRGPFEEAWHIYGYTNTLMGFIDQQELLKEIFEAEVSQIIGMYDILCKEGYRFDGIFLREDLGSTNALLFSSEIYQSVLFPFHKKLCQFFKEKGLPVILHCDGNVGKLIPLFIEAGFTALQPLEVNAGFDVRELKRIYGNKLVLYGNINAKKMEEGSFEEIEQEIKDKVLIAKEGGGYIYNCDYSVVLPSVSFKSYKFVMEMLDKYGRYDK